ncbi:MAG: zinc-dependent alcohol dehydrogenase [Pirellulaceae bacterium]
MRAVAVTQPGSLDIVELAAPVPGPYQALVRTDLAALCNSTDGKLVQGTFPGIDRYPLVLGHESTGLVTGIGEKVRNFSVGDRVIGGLLFEFSQPQYASGWGGFCDFTLANDHDVMVEDGVADAAHGWFECYEIQRAVDADIPAAEAVLMCTWREVLGGFGDFQMQAGESLLIFGAGPVGLSFVKFARLLGLGWIGLVDPLAHKRARAQALGADAVFAPDDAQLLNLTQRRGKPLDIVVDAVGSEQVINTALPLIKLGGTVGVYGVLGSPTLTINKGAAPYNFNLLLHQWPTRWRERESQATLSQWIRGGRLQASEFVTHEFPIERIQDALQTVREGAAVKCLLHF